MITYRTIEEIEKDWPADQFPGMNAALKEELAQRTAAPAPEGSETDEESEETE